MTGLQVVPSILQKAAAPPRNGRSPGHGAGDRLPDHVPDLAGPPVRRTLEPGAVSPVKHVVQERGDDGVVTGVRESGPHVLKQLAYHVAGRGRSRPDRLARQEARRSSSVRTGPAGSPSRQLRAAVSTRERTGAATSTASSGCRQTSATRISMVGWCRESLASK